MHSHCRFEVSLGQVSDASVPAVRCLGVNTVQVAHPLLRQVGLRRLDDEVAVMGRQAVGAICIGSLTAVIIVVIFTT